MFSSTLFVVIALLCANLENALVLAVDPSTSTTSPPPPTATAPSTPTHEDCIKFATDLEKCEKEKCIPVILNCSEESSPENGQKNCTSLDMLKKEVPVNGCTVMMFNTSTTEKSESSETTASQSTTLATTVISDLNKTDSVSSGQPENTTVAQPTVVPPVIPTKSNAETSSTTTTQHPTITTTSANTEHKDTSPSTGNNRHFDAASFVGGIVLAIGLLAIAFVGFKFYRARTEHNYHTLLLMESRSSSYSSNSSSNPHLVV